MLEGEAVGTKWEGISGAGAGLSTGLGPGGRTGLFGSNQEAGTAGAAFMVGTGLEDQTRC